MRKIWRFITVIATISMLFLSGEDAIAKKKKDFNIVSFNMLFEYKKPTDPAQQWVNRKEVALEFFDKYDFDIVGAQELLTWQTEDIIASGKYGRVGSDLAGTRNPGAGTENEAIFYKVSRFELLEEGDFWYSETPEKPASHSWGTGHPRKCTWGKFKDKNTGKIFFVFNSHFHYNVELARTKSAEMLLERVKKVAGDYPVFITGDLNCNFESQAIKTLLAEDSPLKDSKTLTKKVEGPKGTWNGFKTYPEAEKHNTAKDCIDWILVNKFVKVKSYKVIDEQAKTGKWASDHMPVCATVRLK